MNIVIANESQIGLISDEADVTSGRNIPIPILFYDRGIINRDQLAFWFVINYRSVGFWRALEYSMGGLSRSSRFRGTTNNTSHSQILVY